MTAINYDGKIFQLVSNDGPGDVDSETVFFYHQKDNYLWGRYEGGDVVIGIILGKVNEDNSLEFTYQHFDQSGTQKSGRCISYPKIKDGELFIYEQWEWTHGTVGSGTSILKEKNQQ